MPKKSIYHFVLKAFLSGSRIKKGQSGNRLTGVMLVLLFILLPFCILAQSEQVNLGGAFWKTIGNTGTNPAINFIGTADNIPLVFKTNGQPSGIINPLQSNLFFGYWSGRDNSAGTQNAAIGINSSLFNTTSNQNTAAGTSVLENNTASYNTGVGYLALQSNTSGTNNIAIGAEALSNSTTGYSNVAIGRGAGYGVTTGHHNIFLGDSASAVGSNINNSTAIGYGSKVTAPNTIILGQVGNGTNLFPVIIGHTRNPPSGTFAASKFHVALQGTENAIVYRFASPTADTFASVFCASTGTLSSPLQVTPAGLKGFTFYTSFGTINRVVGSISCISDTSFIGPAPLSGRLGFSTVGNSVGGVSTIAVNRTGTLGIGPNNDYWDKIFVMSNTSVPNNVLGTGDMMIGPEDSAGIPHANLTFDWNEIYARIGTSPSTLYLQNEGGAYALHAVSASTVDDFIVTNDANVRAGLGMGLTPAFQLQLATNSAAKPTSTLWTVPSDERLKKDVTPYTEGLDKLLNIKPVWYNYNGSAGLTTEEKGIGTLAADLEQVAPHMIKPFAYKDENGNTTDYKSVDYNAMLFMCINAFKEQQARIDKLKEQNKWLKEQLQNSKN